VNFERFDNSKCFTLQFLADIGYPRKITSALCKQAKCWTRENLRPTAVGVNGQISSVSNRIFECHDRPRGSVGLDHDAGEEDAIGKPVHGGELGTRREIARYRNIGRLQADPLSRRDLPFSGPASRLEACKSSNQARNGEKARKVAAQVCSCEIVQNESAGYKS
jgi:hypothetical protein